MAEQVFGAAGQLTPADAVRDTGAKPAKKHGGRPRSMVWQFYTACSDASETSKRCEVTCDACKAKFLSRVDTMEAHIVQCEACAGDIREMMSERIKIKTLEKAKKEVATQEAVASASAPSLTTLEAPLPQTKRHKSEDVKPERPVIPLRLRFPQVYVPTHPLVAHWLAVCRNKVSPPPIFRSAVAELGRVLIYEAAQDWLPTVSGQVETPLGLAECSFVDPSQPVKVVPILRAGLVLLEQAATVLPSSQTFHVGYVRDEVTLQASMYLNKLPARFAADDRILVCDPMIATGGTVLSLLNELVARGASQEYIRVIAVVVAPPALEAVSKQFPGLRIYAGMIDESLNEQGFIVPGLGDAGDRAFGTAD